MGTDRRQRRDRRATNRNHFTPLEEPKLKVSEAGTVERIPAAANKVEWSNTSVREAEAEDLKPEPTSRTQRSETRRWEMGTGHLLMGTGSL